MLECLELLSDRLRRGRRPKTCGVRAPETTMPTGAHARIHYPLDSTSQSCHTSFIHLNEAVPLQVAPSSGGTFYDGRASQR